MFVFYTIVFPNHPGEIGVIQ